MPSTDETATVGKQVIKTRLKVRIVAIGVALAVGTGMVALSALPSEAAAIPHRLMSHSEYHKIKKNMSIRKVRSIVGSKGKVVYDEYRNGDRQTYITWEPKDRKYWGDVYFVNGKAGIKNWHKGSRGETKYWFGPTRPY